MYLISWSSNEDKNWTDCKKYDYEGTQLGSCPKNPNEHVQRCLNA
jgi:nitrous oxidase accessory protein NosD